MFVSAELPPYYFDFTDRYESSNSENVEFPTIQPSKRYFSREVELQDFFYDF